MEYVLETQELTKIYDGMPVVDSVTLRIGQGDIYGFVGKNGAGKTTFIRTVLGLTKPSGGSFSFFDGMRNMTARQNLELYCTALGVDKKYVDEILDIIKLKDTGKKKAKDFSLGMKQRLGIGMALIGDPELLILDEPINGLDPMGIVEIRELILEMKNRGKTVFISSHFLGELEKIATRYGIIASGRLVEEISAGELKKICTARTIIRTDDPQKAKRVIEAHLKTDAVEEGKDSVTINMPLEDIGELTNKLFTEGITVKGISNDDNSAEEYFIKRMEGK